jgi:hypothetical protein
MASDCAVKVHEVTDPDIVLDLYVKTLNAASEHGTMSDKW